MVDMDDLEEYKYLPHLSLTVYDVYIWATVIQY